MEGHRGDQQYNYHQHQDHQYQHHYHQDHYQHHEQHFNYHQNHEQHSNYQQHQHQYQHHEQHFNYYQHHHQNSNHQHPNHHHHHLVHHNPDPNQFNNNHHNHTHDQHFNYNDSNHQMIGEHNEPFGGGGFRSNFRKRSRTGFNDGSVKLYIAPIPRTMTEENIRRLFEEHGTITEVIIPWHKWNCQQQAYCFVKYATSEEADRAIRALDSHYTIPGEVLPLKVRYADGERERERLGNGEPLPLKVRYADGEQERFGGCMDKLYVGSVNKQASRQEILEIFCPYGHVEDVYIVRDELKQSRGCAFVKFSHKDMASAAIKALNGTFTMRGCDQPLIVRLADPKKPKIGESRGNSAFGGPNFGPCPQEPMIRPPPNFGDSMGGCVMPNVSFPMQQISSNAIPVTVVTHMTVAASHTTEQQLPPFKQSPSQSSQMPLQPAQTPQKYSQSSEQAVLDTHKQTKNFEEQQSAQKTLQESPWTESNPEAASCTAAAAQPPSSQTLDTEECDWSEHACPDGYKYYYNCITCESRWEKPVEFALFQKQLQKQQKLNGSNQQNCSFSLGCSAEEADQRQKELDCVQIPSEASPVVVVDPISV